MFFRHQRPKVLSFEDHLANARAAGFTVQSSGNGTRIERYGIACIAREGQGGFPRFAERAGLVMGDEIGTLVDSGYQKFFQAPSGKRKPALAEELKAIQNFQEDLKEALGLTSLYNESLGTVSNKYLYDRVEGRDYGPSHKPWETA